MAVSFFEHQAQAQRKTKILVVLFVLAVAGVVLAVDALISAIYLFNRFDGVFGAVQAADAAGGWLNLLSGGFLVVASVVTLGLIVSVSLWHTLRLAGRGEEVARMVGARPIPPNADDPLERRLLNVVEEMAIAAGVRVPKVYVMDDERAINAFAAGYDVSSAIVAVTRGTLESLSRDELQGVIGHEFSHILNGDMRLNVRMLGVLEGIVFLSAIGAFLMRNSSRVRGRNAGGVVLTMIAVGVALFVIGYIGLFFSRLIKAAVSRQREFLADASSVQFTRNPDGLAGALDQIALAPAGARISNRYAEEMAHMYFGQSINVWFGAMFDTHPPLDERISRVRPGFARTRYRTSRRTEVIESRQPSTAVPGTMIPTQLTADARRSDDRRIPWPRSASQSAALVGQLGAAEMDCAARLLAALPELIRNRVRDPEGARATVIALLFAHNDELMRQQVDALMVKGLGGLAETALQLVTSTRTLGPSFRLAVVDLALPALKLASAEAKRELIAGTEAAINADRRVSVHEFVVLTLLRAQLSDRASARAAKHASVAAASEHVTTLLSLVAHAGARGKSAAQVQEQMVTAFAAGAREAQLEGLSPLARGALNFDSIARALAELKGLPPLAKAVLIKAMFATATHDGSIRIAEAELLRLAGAVLDCPLPPLLDEIDLATLVA